MVPGNICVTRKDNNPAVLPGNRNRENAYPAVAAKNTPIIVVAPATMVLFNNHVKKGLSNSKYWKLASVGLSGNKLNDILNPFDEPKAIFMTHKTG